MRAPTFYSPGYSASARSNVGVRKNSRFSTARNLISPFDNVGRTFSNVLGVLIDTQLISTSGYIT